MAWQKELQDKCMETADFGDSLEGFPLALLQKFTYKHVLIQKRVLCTLSTYKICGFCHCHSLEFHFSWPTAEKSYKTAELKKKKTETFGSEGKARM